MVSGLVDFAISFLMFVAIMIYYHIHPGWPLLLLPVFLLLAVLTALGVGLWLSALNAIYRDVRYVVPFLVQFWMFASPVVYPSSLVSAKWPKWAWLYGLNPMVGVIEGFRWSLTGTGNPPGRMLLASSVAVVLVVWSAASCIFRRWKRRSPMWSNSMSLPMTESVIRVEGLGKRYRLGEGLRHTALRNLLGDALRAPLRLLTGSSPGVEQPSQRGLTRQRSQRC